MANQWPTPQRSVTPAARRSLIQRRPPSGGAPPAISAEDAAIVNLTPPPPEDVYTGRVLGGRYQLDECIGSGGMGAIYRARRLHIGDTVAVKVLRPEVLGNAVSRERFHREARAAAMLHHPNAVVIHDFGEDEDGTAYIVMELLEGRSLRQILQGGAHHRARTHLRHSAPNLCRHRSRPPARHCSPGPQT